MLRAALFVGLVLASSGVAIVACAGAASHDGTGGASDAAGFAVEVPRLDAAIHPDASCAVTIESPPLLAGVHVPIPSVVDWSSNPPSSGPHYPIWAAFKTFSTPVPRGYYVHDLEHGAVVLLYRCDVDAGGDPGPGGCPDVVASLEQVVAALPDDPLCTASGVRVRAVITPDPLLDVPVAAAAWGWTYKADCLDLPSLEAFASEHYGKGTEQVCANGQTTF